MPTSTTPPPKPRPALTQVKEQLDSTEWEQDFISYYAHARGYDAQALDDAHAVLTTMLLGAEAAEKCLDAAASNVKRAGSDAKGTLGEAHFSYLLERRRRILLTDAGWKTAPFQVSKGIDLVGVLLPELIVCHVEVKTWEARSDGKIRATFKEMTHDKVETVQRKKGPVPRTHPAQLGLARLRPLFTRSSSTGHRATVTTQLLEILAGVGKPDWVDLEALDQDRIDQDLPDHLLRIGGVVADFPGPFPPDVEGPIDVTPDDPCELILLGVTGLVERLDRLTAFEKQLEDRKAIALKNKLRAARAKPKG